MRCLHMAVPATIRTLCKLHALHSCLPSSACDTLYQRNHRDEREKIYQLSEHGVLSHCWRDSWANSQHPDSDQEFGAVLGPDQKHAFKSPDLTFKALHTECENLQGADGTASVTTVSAEILHKCKHITNAGKKKKKKVQREN